MAPIISTQMTTQNAQMVLVSLKMRIFQRMKWFDYIQSRFVKSGVSPIKECHFGLLATFHPDYLTITNSQIKFSDLT